MTRVGAGEPAGRLFTSLSCHAEEALCENLTLDCLDGPSCVAFEDPAYCTCTDATCDGVGSPDRIIACNEPDE